MTLKTLYDFKINSLNGVPFDLSKLKGKKVLLVNVASECGLTPQYTELEYINKQYSKNNFVVIGLPCNDFGAQEPGTPEEIETFCSTAYSVSFPLTEKIHTIGENIHPIYQWLTAVTGNEVTWNFQKFLVNEQGFVVKSIDPQTVPTDPTVLNWIQHG